MTTLTSIKRPAGARGRTTMAWLDSRHTFSFADYDDPDHLLFRALRVINEDYIAPMRGFPTHPHREMEILTYVISGQLTHRDSMGNARTVRSGQAQYMSAGHGVTHSESNDSPTEPAHILQIWIFPATRGGTPAYGEWSPPENQTGPLTLIAAPQGGNGVLALRQNAKIYLGEFKAGQTAVHATDPHRGLWMQVISGGLTAGGEELATGDGLAIENVSSCEIAAKTDARFLLFDLP